MFPGDGSTPGYSRMGLMSQATADLRQVNHLYQYSMMNALMDGVADRGITVAHLRGQGAQGLGTFTHMDGELVLVDGRVWCLSADGPVHEAAPDDAVAFAAATTLEPQQTMDDLQVDDGAMLAEALDTFARERGRNLFVSYRVTGRFKQVRCRQVRGQRHRGQPLPELSDTQHEQILTDVRGVVVGLRTPPHWQGLGVAGDHQHFITDDRTQGGHVLDLTAPAGVRLEMAVVADIHLQLPTDNGFNDADLSTDDTALQSAEG